MAQVNLYADKRADRNGRHSITLYINADGKRLKFRTGIYVEALSMFDGVQVSRQSDNYKVKNMRLMSLKSAADKLLIEIEESKQIYLPAKRVKELILERLFGRNKERIKNFLYYHDEFASLKTTKGTKNVYAMTRKKIEKYDAGCTFDTMNYKWLLSFEAYLLKTVKVNTAAIHLRNIRAVFNYAIDEEITTLYPFRKFKIRKEDTRKRCLTVEQVRELRDYHLIEDWQREYRDIFMLMIYLIGINAADLFNAKEITSDGRIDYHRSKTHKLYSIKVEPEAMEIIEKYRGDKYLLNVLDRYKNYKDFLRRMNEALKKIGGMKRVGQGGKKIWSPLFPELSSYWARHTWATLCAELEVPKETISAGLGHSIGSDVTDIYIKFNPKKVDEANRKVIDYINNIQL
jgi:site-specific recombinase XerD